MISYTEEDYLKAIYKIAEKDNSNASTNAISSIIHTTAASVTDMMKRLAEKELINYKKYRGATLTQKGNQIATHLIRKHRLWEVFLHEKLHFGWEEVHDMAEQLEHIKSTELVNRLDAYLNYPKFDPHGDPIPNALGKFTLRNQVNLLELKKYESGILIGVKMHEKSFLQHLNDHKISLGSMIRIMEIREFDKSREVEVDNTRKCTLSEIVSSNLILKKQLI